MSSVLDQHIHGVKEELLAIQELYEFTQKIKAENAIEQEKIIQQNLTIKHQRDELTKAQADVKAMKLNLDEREKQILIREKSQINSNRLLDEKLNDFREKTIELSEGLNKLKKDQEELSARKELIDQQALINQKMEETEILRKNKIKIKEEQVEKELERLRNLQM